MSKSKASIDEERSTARADKLRIFLAAESNRSLHH